MQTPSKISRLDPQSHSPFLGRAWRRSLKRSCVICLSLFLLSVVLFSSSAAQEGVPHREFSANVLMRMRTEQSGIGARIQVKQDNLHLDYPDLVHHRQIPFWFLSNGLVASVKEATDEDFNPGPGGPLFLGVFLRFRPANPDRFCEEFRPYFIEFMKASAGELSDEDLARLQNPENFACEQTGREIVALRDCRTYRFAGFGMEEYWTSVAFDPKLTTILQIELNPPQGLILKLDAIKEGPQPSSLFIPPRDHIVVINLKKLDCITPQK
jgi:hypothetical protein